MEQDTAFGKMCRELSVPITEMTLPMFLALVGGRGVSVPPDGWKNSGVAISGDGRRLVNGVCLTLNTSEFPNDVVESSLSSILERGGVDSRFYLSKTACSGFYEERRRGGRCCRRS